VQGIPNKGEILTKMSLFWFDKLKDITPNHLITTDVDQMPSDVKVHAGVLGGRAMLVRKAKIIPLEAIVRGYITGALCQRATHNETEVNYILRVQGRPGPSTRRAGRYMG
jgi:phosphoribosylaminoimidazole-succinocarboxamide synthase